MKDDHPTTVTVNESELSPLEQIRHAEAEVTRRVASARQGAEKTLTQARNKAVQQRIHAREEGLREGQAQYQASISSAEEEARTLLIQSRKRVEELGAQGEARLYAAVCQAVNIIIGVEGDGTQNHEH